MTYALVPRSKVLTLAYVPRISDVPTRASVPISVALAIAYPISSVPTYVLVPSSDASARVGPLRGSPLLF